MSKSILVIDTPEDCIKCDFSASRLDGSGRCTLNKDCGNVIPNEGKPDWCPLKNAPQKLGETADYALYGMGWDDCIREILKERD